jgi:putative DNA primase/helicase
MTGLTIRQIATALGGDVSNRTSCNVPGPGHSKADRSLTVTIARGGRLIVHSHAGDDWKVSRDYVHDRLGLGRDYDRNALQKPFVVVDSGPDETKTKTKAWALDIWSKSVNPAGTLVERYLREHRGLQLSGDIAGSVVRFHGSLRFDEFSRKPGMVCLFRDIATNEPCGIHRTFLDRETGQKIDRKMLGVAKRAAIKIDDAESVSSKLTIGEGFETVLAARLAGLGPVWALGSTSGIQFFPVLSGLAELTILEENDAASRKAGSACARRYLAADKPVNVVTPKVGNDLNDVWKAVNA